MTDNDQVPSLTSEEIDSINAIFVDAENDEELSFKPIAPSLDLDALRREADARNAKNIVPMAPVTLPSSSSSKPQHVFGSALEMDDDKEEGGGKKERRKIPKLDEGRLLGPTGFPQLIKDTKNFKPKGKGHETSDLNRLLRIYQFWSHRMFPKTQFRDTVERVEKVCHSRRMHVALSVWRDEARGIVKPQDTEDLADVSDDDQAEKSGPDPTTGDTSDHATSSRVASRSSSPLASSRPPSSASSNNMPLDDDFDIDAFVREEEDRAAALAAQTAELQAKHSYGKSAEGGEGIIDEDELMWEELDNLNDTTKSPAASAAEAPPIPPQATNDVPAANLFDDDEEMADAVHEADAVLQPPSAEIPQPTTAATATNQYDDDWNEMYL